MAIKITVVKKPLKHFTPSRYCEWCFTVEADSPQDFLAPDDIAPTPRQWALDLDPDTDILPPEQARRIKGAPDYKIDPAPGEGTITQPADTKFTICFVAACADRKDSEISLESRMVFPPGAMAAPPQEWRRVPFEDAPNGIGKFVGPALASAAPVPAPAGDGGALAMVAAHEARKTAALLGVTLKSPSGIGGGGAPEIYATERPRIYVTAVPRTKDKSDGKDDD